MKIKNKSRRSIVNDKYSHLSARELLDSIKIQFSKDGWGYRPYIINYFKNVGPLNVSIYMIQHWRIGKTIPTKYQRSVLEDLLYSLS